MVKATALALLMLGTSLATSAHAPPNEALAEAARNVTFYDNCMQRRE
ncbi:MULTISPECIES: hypothetical protein [Halomonadaceae]|nr:MULTISPECIES: hypothetical protein [Halomonas]